MAKTKKEKELERFVETGIALQTKDELNESLKQALDTINKKLEALGVNAVNPVTFKTSGSFKYNELDGNTVNIFGTVDAQYLLRSLAKMKRIKREYDETATEMGLKTYPIAVWYGYPVDSWIHDFEHRVKLVLNATQITELNKSKTELTAFLSAEDRLKETLTKAANLLK